MRLAIAASVLACTSVHALSDSSPSPFVLFSTAKLASSPEVDQLQTSGQVLSIAKELLGSCPTTRYFLVSQPNIHAIDVRGDSGCKMPNLCRVIAHESVGSRFSVSAVMGQIATEQLSDHIKAACLGEGRQSKIEEMRLRALPPMRERERRMDMLADNDYEIGRLLETAQAEGDYTVVFFSDPNETRAYEADFIEPVHMDLKRQSGPLPIGQRAANASSDLPLFEKYQFFTPGIFMGLMALFFMLSILTVGLKALASLQVSYGAFDKEMGPAAQKKQM